MLTPTDISATQNWDNSDRTSILMFLDPLIMMFQFLNVLNQKCILLWRTAPLTHLSCLRAYSSILIRLTRSFFRFSWPRLSPCRKAIWAWKTTEEIQHISLLSYQIVNECGRYDSTPAVFSIKHRSSVDHTRLKNSNTWKKRVLTVDEMKQTLRGSMRHLISIKIRWETQTDSVNEQNSETESGSIWQDRSSSQPLSSVLL